MQGDEEDRGVVAEDLLRSVAVVDVPVEDGDARQSELELGKARRHRYRVEDAETHRPSALGMVSRRAREGETAATYRLDRGSRGEQRGRVGRIGAERVRVEPAPRPANALE